MAWYISLCNGVDGSTSNYLTDEAARIPLGSITVNMDTVTNHLGGGTQSDGSTSDVVESHHSSSGGCNLQGVGRPVMGEPVFTPGTRSHSGEGKDLVGSSTLVVEVCSTIATSACIGCYRLSDDRNLIAHIGNTTIGVKTGLKS
jgi:hypothetical protein